MFAIPTVPMPTIEKRYVIVGIFRHNNFTDWYLCDAQQENGGTTRKWTNTVAHAIIFNTEEDAESIGTVVCLDNEFIVEPLSVRKTLVLQ